MRQLRATDYLNIPDNTVLDDLIMPVSVNFTFETPALLFNKN
jgi:hypothetical protein